MKVLKNRVLGTDETGNTFDYPKGTPEDDIAEGHEIGDHAFTDDEDGDDFENFTVPGGTGNRTAQRRSGVEEEGGSPFATQSVTGNAVNLSRLNRDQLRAYAAENDIDLGEATKADELRTAISDELKRRDEAASGGSES